MATFKPLPGWGMAVVLLGIPGARPGFLYRARACAQPVDPGRVGRTADSARAEVVMAAAKKGLSRWTATLIQLRESPRKHGINLNRTDDASSSGATIAPTSNQ